MLVATKKELARQVAELEVIKTALEGLQETESARLEGMNEESEKYEELISEIELLDTAISFPLWAQSTKGKFEAARCKGLHLGVIENERRSQSSQENHRVSRSRND